MKSYFTALLAPTSSCRPRLNTKAPGGRAAVEMAPGLGPSTRTNDDMLAFGLMLEDVDEANSPLMAIPARTRGRS
ncbi:MAG: hypothetical protein R3D28_08045 [Geminicoccaceae bacterium]